MYVYRNIEARSRNNCCRGRAICVIYMFVCVRAREYVRVPGCLGVYMRVRACNLQTWSVYVCLSVCLSSYSLSALGDSIGQLCPGYYSR